MMKAFFLAIAVVVVVGVSGQSQKCTPKKWEGGIGVSAYCRGLHRAYAKTSYDATNNRTASIWNSEKGGRLRIVTIFKEGSGTRYFIRGDRCCKMAVKGDFKEFCVPDGAKDVGSFYYGLGDNKLRLEAYELRGEGKTIALAMTAQNVPVTYAIQVGREGDDNHGGFASEAEFFDITAGIANASVFNVPDTCNGGCGKQEALMLLIQDDSPLLLMNPFEVENVPLSSLAGLQLGNTDQLKSGMLVATSAKLRNIKMKFIPRLEKLSDLL